MTTRPAIAPPTIAPIGGAFSVCGLGAGAAVFESEGAVLDSEGTVLAGVSGEIVDGDDELEEVLVVELLKESTR